MRLKDRVCIITGGASGIGEATCEVFAREGAIVVIADRNVEGAKALASKIEASEGRAAALEIDVASSSSLKAMVDHVVETFGRIDVLVNNAGFGVAGDVVTTSEEDWNAIMAVNLTGVFLGCKHVVPVMRRQGGGSIINISSPAALAGVAGRAAYSASKGGVAAMTRAMAMDHVGDNIRINSVAPGTTATHYFDDILRKTNDQEAFLKQMGERQPILRYARPEEIAKGILFLASDDSSYSVGSMLILDGGYTAQ